MPRANSQCLSVFQKEGHNECFIALGRSNGTHIGSPQAGPRVAAILSVIETCCRLRTPVREYLGQVLSGLADTPIQRVAQLTPAAWATRTQG